MDIRIINREGTGKTQLYNGPEGSPALVLNALPDGQVRMPKQAAFEAQGNGGWSSLLTGGSWYGYIATERHDANADFDESNGRFTAPHDGYYIFSASWYMHKNTSTAANTYLHPAIFINGAYTWLGGSSPYTIHGNAASNHSVAGYPDGITITRTIYMSSGDYAEAKIYVSASSTWRNYANYSYFAGGYLGG